MSFFYSKIFRHTFNPWLWGLESEMQPGEQGRNVDFIIATIPLEVTHTSYSETIIRREMTHKIPRLATT